MRLLLLLAVAASLLFPIGAKAQAVLRNGDVFELRLGGVPADAAAEFSLPLTVGDRGEVKIPYIGELKAAGVSATELAHTMEKKLVAGKIFTDPTVVLIVRSDTRSVTIGGAVKAPQAIVWRNDLTLSAAIKQAGDFNEFADRKKIKVTRDGQASFFNLKRADQDPLQNPRLLPSDEVTVSE